MPDVANSPQSLIWRTIRITVTRRGFTGKHRSGICGSTVIRLLKQRAPLILGLVSDVCEGYHFRTLKRHWGAGWLISSRTIRRGSLTVGYSIGRPASMRLNTLFSLFLPARTLHGCAPRRSRQPAEREFRARDNSGGTAAGGCAATPVCQPRSQIRCGTGYDRLTTYSKLLRVPSLTQFTSPANVESP